MKNILFPLTVALALFTIAPAAEAQVAAYACTREANSATNIRRGPATYFPVVTSVPNRRTVLLSGKYVVDPQGEVWAETANGNWANGRYICLP